MQINLMALPIHKEHGSRRWKVDVPSYDESLAEQEHAWDKRSLRNWRLTDNSDNPTNRPAWKVFEDQVKGSYSKPQSTVARNKAREEQLKAVDVDTSLRTRHRNLNYNQFTILDRDAKFKPEYMNREGYRAASDYRRREHWSLDLDGDVAAQIAATKTWAAPGRSSRLEARLKAHREGQVASSVMRMNDNLDFYDSSDAEDDARDYSATSSRPSYVARRRIADEDDIYDSITDGHDAYEALKSELRATHRYQPIPHGVIDNGALEMVTARPGASLSSEMFKKENERTGTSAFLSAALRTPAYWSKRFEDFETNKYDVAGLAPEIKITPHYQDMSDVDDED